MTVEGDKHKFLILKDGGSCSFDVDKSKTKSASAGDVQKIAIEQKDFKKFPSRHTIFIASEVIVCLVSCTVREGCHQNNLSTGMVLR